MKKSYTGIKSFPQHDENPFTPQLGEIRLKTKRIRIHKGNDLIDEETGEIVAVNPILKTVEYDPDKYFKIFIDEIQRFFVLQDRSIKLLIYLMKNSKPKQDFVLFDRSKCANDTEMSEATIFRALGDLIDNDFIARSEYPYKYYINPTIFFNGDRVAFIKLFNPRVKK